VPGLLLLQARHAGRGRYYGVVSLGLVRLGLCFAMSLLALALEQPFAGRVMLDPDPPAVPLYRSRTVLYADQNDTGTDDPKC